MMRAMWLAGVALTMTSAAQAGEVGELGCFEATYTAEQTSQINRLLPEIDMLAGESPAMDSMAMLIGTAAASCAATYGWEDDETQSAVLHELGRLTELGVRRHGPLPQEEIARIDAALATGDRTALWNALEEQLLLGMSGQMDAAGTENPGLIGAFMLELGLGVDEGEVERAGEFLAIKAMQRVATRAFAAR